MAGAPEKHDAHGGGGGGDAHGGGEHKAHKKHAPHPPHEEHEEGVAEWVVSFADNALLQMGFFVILLALNLKPASTGSGGAKPSESNEAATASASPPPAMLDGAIAIREAFNNPVNMSSANPNDAPLIRRIIQRKEGESRDKGPRGESENVQSVRPTDYHRIGGLVLFEEDSSEVSASGQETIASLTEEVRGRKTILEVRGHCSVGEAYQPLDKGMKLSFDRALTVAQSLVAGGLSWDQVRVVACGAGDRVAPIARSSGEQLSNQRVEVILTDEAVPADPYAVDPSGAAAGAGDSGGSGDEGGH
jgi:outer membrane protein OmpA-like peptidoglycan-associated protein